MSEAEFALIEKDGGLAPPLSSPGGKAKWVGKLLPLVPPHKIYVEPYAGGASLFFAKEPAEKEVLCDIDGEIVDLYRWLKSASDADFELGMQ